MAGTMGRRTPSEPGFHPSRDVAHHRGDETSTGQGVFLDQGETPSRLELFGAQSRGDAPARNASRLLPMDPTAIKHVKELGHSKIPTQHFAGYKSSAIGEGNGILIQGENLERNDPGHYRAASASGMPVVSAGPASRADATMIHELGHARHYDTTPKIGRDHLTKSYRDARGFAPDPLKEAVADAYVDRYGGRLSAAKTAGDYSHVSDRQFGYSSEYEVERGANAVWNQTDRAIYAGTRAHFSETGDIPQYQSRMNPAAVERGQYLRSGVEEQFLGSDPISDATIHHLSQSPHAREAWSQTTTGALRTPLSQVAEEASRRHKDRRLLNEGQFTQQSMFVEMKTDAGEHRGFAVHPEYHTEGHAVSMKDFNAHDTDTDIAWPHTLEHNQFGEEPRTSADIQGSLGLSRSDVKQFREPSVSHLPSERQAPFRSNRKDFD